MTAIISHARDYGTSSGPRQVEGGTVPLHLDHNERKVVDAKVRRVEMRKTPEGYDGVWAEYPKGKVKIGCYTVRVEGDEVQIEVPPVENQS